MPARKTYKVRVRMKVRNSLLRRGAAVAGASLGLLAAFWLFGAAFKAGKNLISERLLAFRPDSYEIDCPSQAAAAYARELAAGALHSRLTAASCDALAEQLKKRHPALASVSVGRNFLTGKLSVKARPEPAVAAVLIGGATAYLSESGRLMPETLAGGEAPQFRTELGWRPAEAPGLAGFLKEVSPLVPLFYSRPAALDCPAKDWTACSFRLEDGTAVLWGGFEFTRLKILRLNEVAQDAALRKPPPFRVDLRYFKEGKIFVSAVRPAGR